MAQGRVSNRAGGRGHSHSSPILTGLCGWLSTGTSSLSCQAAATHGWASLDSVALQG